MLSALLGGTEAAQPSRVECLLIFDPRLGGEADSERKVLFCHPPDSPVDAQLNAIGLAEGLSVQHGEAGVRVSVLCPQAVDTPMIAGRAGSSAAKNDGVIAADALSAA